MKRTVLCLLVAVWGCDDQPGAAGNGGGMGPTGGSAATGAMTMAAAFALPPSNAPLDYQLGGAYAPPAGVKIVSRDRKATPAAGLYNICYINGFQAQPDEDAWWLSMHPDLVLRDDLGKPVIDLDTHARSADRISQNDAMAYMRLLSDRAHAVGLAIAQKNSAEVLSRKTEMGRDVAVLSIVLRDLNLVAPGRPAHVYEGC